MSSFHQVLLCCLSSSSSAKHKSTPNKNRGICLSKTFLQVLIGKHYGGSEILEMLILAVKDSCTCMK